MILRGALARSWDHLLRCSRVRLLIFALPIWLFVWFAFWSEHLCSLWGVDTPDRAEYGAVVLKPDNERAQVQAALARQTFYMCEFFVQHRRVCRNQYSCLIDRLQRQPSGFLREPQRSCWRTLEASLTDPKASQLVRMCYSSNSTRSLDVDTVLRVSEVNGCARSNGHLWMTLMVRNEARLLVENMLYHLSLGVERFLIYDDRSSDNLREALRPFVEAGVATYLPITGEMRQLQVYDTAVQYARGQRVRWLGVIDADEFFVSTRDVCIGTVLEDVYRRNAPNISTVAVNWRFVQPDVVFDTRGLFQAERANFSAGLANLHVKAFVIPDRVGRFRTPHSNVQQQWRYAVSPGGRAVRGPFLEPPDAEDTALLHFQAKTPVEWIRKRIRGKPDIPDAELMSEKGEFDNDDALSLLDEWPGFEEWEAPPDHPLARQLRWNIARLYRALESS